VTNAVFVSALTLALAVSGAAFAQSTTVTPNPPSPAAAKQQKTTQQSALTIEKLTQDMQKAGFTEVKVLEDAFLIQAKTKDGNPIVMSIGPNGMSALEAAAPSTASPPSTTGQALPDNKPVTAPAKPAQH
jgi:hypothetical protein